VLRSACSDTSKMAAGGVDGDVIRWIGEHTRCTATFTDGGLTQVAHHESSPDGVTWSPSMEVTLCKST